MGGMVEGKLVGDGNADASVLGGELAQAGLTSKEFQHFGPELGNGPDCRCGCTGRGSGDIADDRGVAGDYPQNGFQFVPFASLSYRPPSMETL